MVDEGLVVTVTMDSKVLDVEVKTLSFSSVSFCSKSCEGEKEPESKEPKLGVDGREFPDLTGSPSTSMSSCSDSNRGLLIWTICCVSAEDRSKGERTKSAGLFKEEDPALMYCSMGFWYSMFCGTRLSARCWV